jgi:hypothetical protein
MLYEGLKMLEIVLGLHMEAKEGRREAQ